MDAVVGKMVMFTHPAGVYINGSREHPALIVGASGSYANLRVFPDSPDNLIWITSVRYASTPDEQGRSWRYL